MGCDESTPPGRCFAGVCQHRECEHPAILARPPVPSLRADPYRLWNQGYSRWHGRCLGLCRVCVAGPRVWDTDRIRGAVYRDFAWSLGRERESAPPAGAGASWGVWRSGGCHPRAREKTGTSCRSAEVVVLCAVMLSWVSQAGPLVLLTLGAAVGFGRNRRRLRFRRTDPGERGLLCRCRGSAIQSSRAVSTRLSETRWSPFRRRNGQPVRGKDKVKR